MARYGVSPYYEGPARSRVTANDDSVNAYRVVRLFHDGIVDRPQAVDILRDAGKAEDDIAVMLFPR